MQLNIFFNTKTLHTTLFPSYKKKQNSFFISIINTHHNLMKKSKFHTLLISIIIQYTCIQINLKVIELTN